MTGYPWSSGDELDAGDLNDAIAGRAPAVALTTANAALAAASEALSVANAAIPAASIGKPNGVLGLDSNGHFQVLSGTTLERPTAAATGTQYLDTDLGMVITRNGVSWINAAGAIV